jgi:hypothetical protein
MEAGISFGSEMEIKLLFYSLSKAKLIIFHKTTMNKCDVGSAKTNENSLECHRSTNNV